MSGLRDDLLEAATAAAGQAKGATASQERREGLEQVKVALEAAAIVGAAVTPDEISAALNDLGTELEAAGVFHEAQTLTPAEFLKAVLRGVVSMQVELGAMRQKAGAYMALDGFVEGLAAEYVQSADQRHGAADDPARRVANRMLETLERTREAAGIEARTAS